MLRLGPEAGEGKYLYNRLGRAALEDTGLDRGLELLHLQAEAAAHAGREPLSSGVSASVLDQQSLLGGLAASSKLAVLDGFLQSVRAGDASPTGGRAKVVLVSSSTQMLDVVQLLAGARGWPLLRLDGSV